MPCILLDQAAGLFHWSSELSQSWTKIYVTGALAHLTELLLYNLAPGNSSWHLKRRFAFHVFVDL